MFAPHTKIISRTGLLLALSLFALTVSNRVQDQMIDVNTNGMSDVWEVLYGATGLSPTDDTDGDGALNRIEAIAGTDPFDSNSVPRISVAVMAGTNFSVSIP